MREGGREREREREGVREKEGDMTTLRPLPLSPPEPLGTIWGPPGPILEASQSHLGAFLGPSWGLLGASGDPLRTSWGPGGLLDPLGGFSKPSWGHPGASWGLLGALFGPLGGLLGPSWGALGAIPVHLGTLLKSMVLKTPFKKLLALKENLKC